MSVSLDGYIEGPRHEIDWHLVDDEFNAYAVKMLKASDAHHGTQDLRTYGSLLAQRH